MLKHLLSVSHLPQRAETDCLPICTQMVLHHLNMMVRYEDLIHLLGTKWFGTPFRNVKQVETLGFSVNIAHLSLTDIETVIINKQPVIACVHTADLSYWSQAVDHVVVVIGFDNTFVYLNDPSFPNGQQPVLKTEFELAQINYDNLCAVINQLAS